MIDCTKTCEAIGAACATCDPAPRPGDLRSGYVPRPMTPFHQAACALVAAAERNESDALDARNNLGRA